MRVVATVRLIYIRPIAVERLAANLYLVLRLRFDRDLNL